ncbi:acetate--CoA ligase [Acetobacter sp. AN02]|uniref:acetate--CoA ligase n=1 Tax=Acetobacter sp. AN02 TaxID=2894186 RepID=UPI0024344375|nr:acetate--CoA ligase [Acetobacter sp. AN02]MDG6093853.1 acetate--CoA ligase [Acetobacter sp. AN02]
MSSVTPTPHELQPQIIIAGVTPGQTAAYDALVAFGESDPDGFWLNEAKRITWTQDPTRASTSSFTGDVRIRWFEDGRLNASVSCLDRHLKERADQPALIWEGETDGDRRTLTYRELHTQVSRTANALRSLGVKKGDRVAIHLPMVAEGLISMLACARIGAPHVVMFGGFSPEGISERLVDSGAVAVITADTARRGSKRIPHKTAIDQALKHAGTIGAVRNVIVVTVTGDEVPMKDGRDIRFTDLIKNQSADCEPEIMNAEDPLFLLYTSGSTGKPKAIVHATGGYMVWASYTFGTVYPQEPGDVHWCTADIAWITGHSCVVYGPLANGTTTLMYEGLPSWPRAGRWWDIIQRNRVTSLFTAPTAIRALMREGDDFPGTFDLSSLRSLGTAGEPISADAWMWYYEVIGKSRAAVIDTWWQTETAGIILGPVVGATPMKPGSATKPLPGIGVVVTDDKGNVLEGAAEGCFCITTSWPGQARTIWQDHKRFRETYFTFSEGKYFTGDGVRRDEDGYYWITGRMDDVINVSGHRIGTAEIEDAVAVDHRLAEAAAVGIQHDLKGQGIVVFVVTRASRSGVRPEDIAAVISRNVGRYAAPEKVYLVSELPKTRSGKIVRRLLRKIAEGQTGEFGDLSSLADTSVVDTLIADVARQNQSENV